MWFVRWLNITLFLRKAYLDSTSSGRKSCLEYSSGSSCMREGRGEENLERRYIGRRRCGEDGRISNPRQETQCE